MLDFLEKIGMESAPVAVVEDVEVKEIIEGIESISFDQFMGALENFTNKFSPEMELSNEEYMEGIENEIIGSFVGDGTEAGMETAYTKNRSLISGAIARLKLAFSIDGDKAMAEYADILKTIEIGNIEKTSSRLLFDKENLKAYDAAMRIASTITTPIKDVKLESIIKDVEKNIDSKIKKIILASIIGMVPIVNLLTIGYCFILLAQIEKETLELERQHGEKIRKALTKIIMATPMAKDLKLTVKDGELDASQLTKVTTAINNVKMDMYPLRLRRRSSLPTLLQSKVKVNYEDKVLNAKLIKKNADFYLKTLGDTPIKRTNAMRYCLAPVYNISQEGNPGYMQGGLAGISSIYAGFGVSLINMFIDLCTTTLLLTKDLKSY